MKIFVGNWKMNKTSLEAVSYLRRFKQLVKNSSDIIIVAAPFTSLCELSRNVKNSNILLAAQDVYFEESGAFTGEVSPRMIREFTDYVIIGHSERRKYFNESDEILNKKSLAALKNKLNVVFCVGESLEEREKNLTKEIIRKQLLAGLEGVNISKVTIAYEPVWAIGTGKNATPLQAEEVHAYIKEVIKDKFEKSVKVIYGGSVTPENATELLKMKNVDGCLPGGASLDEEKFAKIINAAK